MFRILSLLLAIALAVASARAQTPLDDFDTLAPWKVVASDGVRATIAADSGEAPGSSAIRIDYDFVSGAGFCLIHRDLPLDLPDNFEFSFQVRGAGPANNLEFKLLDPSGESVWWVNRRAFEWPALWQRLINKKRDIEFAWGPAAGAPIRRLGAIEFAIASSSGGRGSVWIDTLRYRPLPPPSSLPLQPAAVGDAAAAVDGDDQTVWRPALSDGRATLTLDLGSVREFGGLELRWEAPPDRVSLATSDDGQSWAPLGTPARPGIRTTILPTPQAEARFVQLTLGLQDTVRPIGLREVRLRAPDFAPTHNALLHSIAAEAPRGMFPREFLNEQSYWTVVGAPGSTAEALINEEGQIEVGKRLFSIEPFIQVQGAESSPHLLTWADAANEASLEDRALPIPTVTRRHPGLQLDVQPLAAGDAQGSTLYITYTLTNTAAEAARGTLHLTVRPFQVNPPWQRLNFEGGVSPIRSIEALDVDGLSASLRIHTDHLVTSLSPGGTPSVTRWDAGEIAEWLSAGTLPVAHDPQTPHAAHGDDGLCSGALSYAYTLAPGQSRRVTLRVALAGDQSQAIAPGPDADSQVAALRGRVREEWSRAVSRATITVPAADRWVADTFRSQQAYILINRDGPALQPGSRSYERSWARDGSMTSAAMIECGHPELARAWVDWFGAHLFESGKVPCVVDVRGPDPVPENDSHGQYLWAVSNYDRYHPDPEFLRSHWPRVKHVVAYIQSLRAQRLTPEYDTPERAAFRGLVPESISHEGYSAKPMHSYWDDFFVLLGLKEAARIADRLGERDAAREYAALADEFRSCLLRSITLTMTSRGITYIPGCVELADFDSTSTTIIGFPCDEIGSLPPEAVRGTFDRYWEFFTTRERGAWEAYTPYELRHVGVFARLGEPERAYEALQWFHQHQRPAGWNHWAEVVWNEPLTPKFVGDMPHTWVGSDFLNSVRALFLFERGESLVLFAGIPQSWALSSEPVAFQRLAVPGGTLSGVLRRDGGVVRVSVSGQATLPVGGIEITLPPGCAGKPVRIHDLPAVVEFEVREASEPSARDAPR